MKSTSLDRYSRWLLGVQEIANDGEGSWRRVLSNAEGVESVVILFDF